MQPVELNLPHTRLSGQVNLAATNLSTLSPRDLMWFATCNDSSIVEQRDEDELSEVKRSVEGLLNVACGTSTPRIERIVQNTFWNALTATSGEASRWVERINGKAVPTSRMIPKHFDIGIPFQGECRTQLVGCGVLDSVIVALP